MWWHECLGDPRLRALEKENSRLKRLLANRDLEIDALRKIVSKQMVTVEQKRETIRVLKDGLSERKSCRLLGIDRSSMHYQPTTRPLDRHLRRQL